MAYLRAFDRFPFEDLVRAIPKPVLLRLYVLGLMPPASLALNTLDKPTYRQKLWRANRACALWRSWRYWPSLLKQGEVGQCLRLALLCSLPKNGFEKISRRHYACEYATTAINNRHRNVGVSQLLNQIKDRAFLRKTQRLPV